MGSFAFGGRRGGSTLQLTGLSSDVDDQDVAELFAEYGVTLRDVVMMSPPPGGALDSSVKNGGECWLTFPDIDKALKAKHGILSPWCTSRADEFASLQSFFVGRPPERSRGVVAFFVDCTGVSLSASGRPQAFFRCTRDLLWTRNDTFMYGPANHARATVQDSTHPQTTDTHDQPRIQSQRNRHTHMDTHISTQMQ